MPKAYLTIDDSPSRNSTQLLDALHERGVPAIIYCRGDALEENPAPMVRAIKQGFTLANHAFRHKPASEMGIDKLTQGISLTENLIDMCYGTAHHKRPGKYFRFPYIDRGNGDRIERRFFDLINAVNQGNTPELPEDDTVRSIQNFLKNHGFTQPFKGVTHPLYQVPTIKDAHDCLFTYSTGDWMLNERHRGTQPLQSLDDLKNALDNDPYVLHEGGNQIILIHDQPEITDSVIALVDHMLARNIEFLDVSA